MPKSLFIQANPCHIWKTTHCRFPIRHFWGRVPPSYPAGFTPLVEVSCTEHSLRPH